MPTVYDATGSLLRLGVSDVVIADIQPFDLGGAGIIENSQPFDIEAPYVGVMNFQPFDIGTKLYIQNIMPFDLGEVAGIRNIQPFDIVATITNPTPGTTQDPVVVSGTTQLQSAAPAGSSTITVTNGTVLTAGSTIYIGGQAYVIYSVTPTGSPPISTVVLTTPLITSYVAGTTVLQPSANTQTTGSVSSGATTITVTDASDFTVGQTIGIGTTGGAIEYRQVIAIAGNTITLSAPLGSSYTAGSNVFPAPNFLTGISIFNKAGVFLGQIIDYSFNETRSYSISESGSMGFYMPRNSPDVALIQGDRMVAVTNEVGLPLWAGIITTQEWTGSTGSIHCDDAFALLTGIAIELDMEILDGTPATALYQAVIDLVNTQRALDGEILWGTRLNATAMFLGDFNFSGDPDDALREIADRSGTEYAWEASVVGGQLYLTLVVEDSFAAGAGVALTDGDGGNVVASPTYQVDPTTIINGLRLTGDKTNIAAYVADWAEWAIYEIEPVVEVYADPGEYRRRIDLDIAVDFSISKAQQRGLGLRTQDEVWSLYERYVYAIHDIEGRPNHPGWEYEGPTEELEPILTKDQYRTHRELALYYDNRPVSIVMKSDDYYIVVIWNQTFSLKSVRKHPIGDLRALPWVTGTAAAGTYTIYEESDGQARVYTYYTTSGEDFILAASSITARLPNGQRITLRGILGGLLRGRYVNLAEAGWSITPYPLQPYVDTTGNQIGHIFGYADRPGIRDWDPRRDGTGALLTKPTVYDGKLTTRARWHVVPYSTGEEAETRLAEGTHVVDMNGPDWNSYADTIIVESAMSFPINNLPFDILVGDPLDRQEMMRVTEAFGTRWTVQRGVTSTLAYLTADVGAGATVIPLTDTSMFLSAMVVIIGNESLSIDSVQSTTITLTNGTGFAHASGTSVATSGLISGHAAGEIVRLVGGVPFEGFKYPYTWPEGEAYALNLLARLRLPTRLLSLNVTNEQDDWSTFKLGSTHAVNIASEGPPGGVVATVRCIGFSPNEESGEMEVIVEVIS